MPEQHSISKTKRLLDIVVAACALVVLSPLMLAISLLVFLSAGRPILFRQRRSGLNGRPFELLKFRTMRVSEHSIGDERARLTRIGKILRRLSLDELPQLWHVLKGDMSLVGPRPLLLAYLDRYTQQQARRHDVTPGLTGWAQINGRNAIDWEAKFELDLWYVDHCSIWLDLQILAKTALHLMSAQWRDDNEHEIASEFLGSPKGERIVARPLDQAGPVQLAEMALAATEKLVVSGEAFETIPGPRRERIFLSPPHMQGHEYGMIGDVFSQNWVSPAGPFLDTFEKDVAAYVGVRGALATSSATAALHLLLRCLDVGPGDDVVCSTLTFCATANPIVYQGATPVFIDSDRVSWNMDPNLLQDEIASAAKRGKLPKAVIVVDIFGQSTDMDAILEITSRYGIPVIEDAAQAMGTKYRGEPVGRRAWATVFSFNGNKIITTGGGGAICSNDQELLDNAKYLGTQARDPVPHYEHSQVGYNYRLSAVLAAIGIGQLQVIDDRVAARRRNFDLYSENLALTEGISFMPEADFGRTNRWMSVVEFDRDVFGASPEQIRQQLELRNIESRRAWKPMHLQPVFSNCRVRQNGVAESIFERGLCLPSGSALEAGDLMSVVDGVLDARHVDRRAFAAAAPSDPQELRPAG